MWPVYLIIVHAVLIVILALRGMKREEEKDEASTATMEKHHAAK